LRSTIRRQDPDWTVVPSKKKKKKKIVHFRVYALTPVPLPLPEASL